MDRQVRTRRVGRPDDLLAGDGDLCALAVHRLCLHLPGDQEPARARTGQCPTRSERDDRRTWHEGERMSDTAVAAATPRSEEHTSELQSLMRISYAVFCLKKKKHKETNTANNSNNCTLHTINIHILHIYILKTNTSK